MHIFSTVCMVNNSLHPSACFRISCLSTARQLSENRPCVQAIISLLIFKGPWYLFVSPYGVAGYTASLHILGNSVYRLGILVSTRALRGTKYWSHSRPILQWSVLLHNPATHACIGIPRESRTHLSSPAPAQSRMHSLCGSLAEVQQL